MPKELRIGVVMSGGVSLAIWMGGVTAELLRLVKEPRRYGIDPTEWTPMVDVVTGTSAGGLNGVLLAAAVAWDIPPDTFAEDVRRTWIQMAAIDDMLRSPTTPNPPSLLDGDEVLEPKLRDLLASWYRRRRSTPPSDLSLTLTTTLLEPRTEAYYDSLGQRFLESKHAETLTFRADHFLEDDAPERLAAAARASSAFPVAFEPRRLDRTAPDMADHIHLGPDGLWAIDGGVLDNRPLGLALRTIRDRAPDAPFKRVVAYIVPDPHPPGTSPGSTTPSGAGPDTPTILSVLSSVVKATSAQSIAADLDEWQRTDLLAKQQRDLRFALADLDAVTRLRVVRALYPRFREQRALVSAGNTIDDLLKAVVPADSSTDWSRLYDRMVQGRLAQDWRPADFPVEPPGEGEGDGEGEGEGWAWGLRTLRYMASTLNWVILRVADGDSGEGPVRQQALDTAQAVATIIDRYYELSRMFWAWEIESRYVEISQREATVRIEAQEGWASDAYDVWPQPRTRPDNRMADAYAGRLDGYARTVTRINELSARFAPFVARPHRRLDAGDPAGIAQDDYRHHLSWLAACLAETYHRWVETLPAATGGDEAIELARALVQRPPEAAEQGSQDVLWHLLTYWVIQVATSRVVITSEPVDVFLISGDRASPLLGRTFPSAGAKLAGVQLAHFGAFYKRSWRANDWMWGRLDGSERLLDMARVKASAALPSGYVDDRQLAILRRELPVVRRQIERSTDDGGAAGPPDFCDLYDERVASAAAGGPAGTDIPDTVPDDTIRELLASCRLGEERIAGEVGSDQLTHSATKALAVAATALHGEGSGLGPARQLFGQVRNLVLLPLYAQAKAVKQGSNTTTALSAAALIVAVSTIVLDVAMGAEIPTLVLTVAYAVLGFWVLHASATLGRWSPLTLAAPAALALLLLAAAHLLVWAVGSDGGDLTMLRCDGAPVLVTTGEADVFAAPSCELVEQPSTSSPHLGRNLDRIEVGVGLLTATAVALAVLAWWFGSGWAASSSVAFAAVLLVPAALRWLIAAAALGRLPALGLVLALAVAVAAAAGPAWLVAGLARRRDPGGPDGRPLGVVSGVAVAGLAVVVVVVGRWLDGGDAPPWLSGVAPALTRWSAWLLVGAALLPTITVSLRNLLGKRSASAVTYSEDVTDIPLNQEHLLGMLRTSCRDRTAVYLSVPITSGKRRIDLAAELGGLEAAAAEPKLVVEKVQRPNEADAKTLAEGLRSQLDEVIIDPSQLAVQGWTQWDYIRFWLEVIDRFARCVVAAPGWEYSRGARTEVGHALRMQGAAVGNGGPPIELKEAALGGTGMGGVTLTDLDRHRYDEAIGDAKRYMAERGLPPAEIEAYFREETEAAVS